MGEYLELVVVPVIEAHVIAGRLRSEGIDAQVFDPPPGGPYPGVGDTGARVVVPSDQLATATALLDS